MPISVSSKVLLRKAIYGVQVIRKDGLKLKIRLNPYCEVWSSQEELKKLQDELLAISVTSSLRPHFLRIAGVENCSSLTGFISDLPEKRWWLECITMFKMGEHKTRRGVLMILSKRPPPKNAALRVPTEEIIQRIMED